MPDQQSQKARDLDVADKGNEDLSKVNQPKTNRQEGKDLKEAMGKLSTEEKAALFDVVVESSSPRQLQKIIHRATLQDSEQSLPNGMKNTVTETIHSSILLKSKTLDKLEEIKEIMKLEFDDLFPPQGEMMFRMEPNLRSVLEELKGPESYDPKTRS